MSKFKKQKQHDKKEAQVNKRRLNGLPKPLRKLETNLDMYVEFVEIYDGYIGDFTGEIAPNQPIENPFYILNEMDLRLPNITALSKELRRQYEIKIVESFNKMGFHIDIENLPKAAQIELYELLYFYITNPPTENIQDFTELKYKDTLLYIERIDFDNTNY